MALSDALSEGVGAGLGVRALLKRHDPSIQWTTRLSNWQNLHENRAGLSAREVIRGWKYTIADVVATLQLGLVQWVRQDAIVVLQPSRTQVKNYHNKLASNRNSAWGNEATPEYPVARPVCEFAEPVCPTEMIMRRQLHAAWTLTRETAESWAVLRSRALRDGVWSLDTESFDDWAADKARALQEG